MKITDLKVGEGNADIEADVIEMTEPRTFDKFGRILTVSTATLKDESGTVKMSLWNQDIEKVKVGSRIKVTNGFVKEFQGEKQLTAGKLGKIEVLGKAESPVQQEKTAGEASKETSEGPVEESEEESEEFL